MSSSPDERHGDWIQTFGGRAFWPLDPRPEDVAIGDIAHALAHLCRYGGHTRRFYSVAEHSVLMARAVSPKHRLWALLHDASEAYLVDLPRPIKRAIPQYRTAEAAEMPEEVHLADGRILTDERQQSMAEPPMPWNAEEQVEPLGVRLEFWTPVYAEIQFMTMFDMLTGGRFGPVPASLPRGASLQAGAHV